MPPETPAEVAALALDLPGPQIGERIAACHRCRKPVRMRSVSLRILFPVFVLLSGCGTNTDTPVYPIFSSVLSVGTPALIDIQQLTSVDPILSVYPPEFKISFYVTNTEDDFIGYNLYITQNYVAGDATLAGIAGTPYLPDGLDPSFSYTKANASTKAADIKTQTIIAFKPPPSPIYFQFCRFYYFSLRAVMRNGTMSPMSPQLSSCIHDANFCPTDASCQ